jgi:hypothetical protein
MVGGGKPDLKTGELSSMGVALEEDGVLEDEDAPMTSPRWSCCKRSSVMEGRVESRLSPS